MDRWFVRRGEETVGPVDEGQVAGWVRGGMLDAEVREEHGGEWRPIASSRLMIYVRSDPDRGSPRRSARKGIGCGWWAIIAILAAVTLGACAVAPHIGWTGWALIIGAYFIGSHLQKQEERIAELESRHADDHDDFRNQW